VPGASLTGRAVDLSGKLPMPAWSKQFSKANVTYVHYQSVTLKMPKIQANDSSRLIAVSQLAEMPAR
jgi:hypothetical protein